MLIEFPSCWLLIPNPWQILRVVEIEKNEDVKRPYIKQLITKGLTFPLPHRVPKISNAKIFSAKRPSTFA
jgi:large subunit ribosomal protein L18Ae